MTLLHIAAKCEKAPFGMVQVVFEACQESSKKVDNTGSTPLHYLCQRRARGGGGGGSAEECGGRCLQEIKLLLNGHPEAAAVQDRCLKKPSLNAICVCVCMFVCRYIYTYIHL